MESEHQILFSNKYRTRFEHDKVAIIIIIYEDFFLLLACNASVNAHSIYAVTLNHYAFFSNRQAIAATMKN